jgi:hypothetical protein
MLPSRQKKLLGTYHLPTGHQQEPPESMPTIIPLQPCLKIPGILLPKVSTNCFTQPAPKSKRTTPTNAPLNQLPELVRVQALGGHLRAAGPSW